MTTNRYSPPNYNDHPEHGERGFEDMCGHGAQGGTSPSFMVQEIGIFCDFLCVAFSCSTQFWTAL